MTAQAKKTADANTAIANDAAKLAQQSVDQAEAAFDKASDLAHDNVQVFDATANAFKAQLLELQGKAAKFTQANAEMGFAFARKAVAANEPAALFALQKDFMETQFALFTQQMSELGTASFELVEQTAKPMQSGVIRSFQEARKAFSA